jgi:hypothetical protein
MAAVSFLLIALGFVGGAFVVGGSFLYFRDHQALRFARVSLKSKCPACGHRGCMIKIAETDGGKMIGRTCNVCTAVAYETCVVKPGLWAVK